MKITAIRRATPVLLLLCLTQVASAFYDPSLGRWINRDPIGDSSFLRTYLLEHRRSQPSVAFDDYQNASFAFVNNDPMDSVDSWGALRIQPIPPGQLIINPIAPVLCADRIKDEVWAKYGWDENGNPASDHRPGDDHFHFGHCVAHCRMQRECPGGRVTSWAGGLIKEVKDGVVKFFGGGGDGFSGGDLDANREGRRRGRQCPKQSCEEACNGTEG